MSSPASGAQTPTEGSSESAQPDASPPRDRRLGTVGLIALVVCVVVGAAAGVTAWLTHGFHGTVTVRYHQAAVFSAQVGDCINFTPNGTVVHVVPCAGAHDAEVFGTFHLSGDKWPGTAAMLLVVAPPAKGARAGISLAVGVHFKVGRVFML